MDTPQRLVFGAVADAYDAHRPTYPTALIDDIVGRAGTEAVTVDVGCGTGIVTDLLAARGLRGTGLEPDPGMLAVARRKLEPLGWTFLESDFETAPIESGSVDLITCGQAWHWVDPDRGQAKAIELLRPGGWLVLFWNRPTFDPAMPVRMAMDAVYRRLAPDMSSSLRGEGKEPKGRPLPADPPPSGFADAEVVVFEHTITYTSQAWVDLLGTHSNHVMLPEATRTELHGDIGRVIDDHGGSFDLLYRTEAWFGRRS